MSAVVKICLLAAALTAVVCNQVCLASDDGRFESWNQIGACAEINKNWEFEFETELKYGDDASQLYCHNIDFGFVYTGLADWIDLGLMYKREYETDDEGRWRPENRPHLNLTLKGSIVGFDVSNRSRFEYRDLDVEEDFWRYRNMVKVKFPSKFTRFGLQPYLAEEPFIDMRDGKFNKNRLYAGVYCTLTRGIRGALFYLWEASKSGENWEDFNIVGINIVFHIGSLANGR